MIWSPFGRGSLFIEKADQTQRVKETLTSLSAKYNNAAVDQLTLAWILNHPSKPLPVIGTGKMERIKGAVGSLSIDMSNEDWYRILTASKGHEVP